MRKGFGLLDDAYTRMNIVSFLGSSDIKSLSQQNHVCAHSCAFMCSRKYAECIATNQPVPVEVISVLRRVVRVEEVNELSISIVDKIFEISGSVLLRKGYHRLPPLFKELMNEYHINNLDNLRLYSSCCDIPTQIIQHITQCCIVNNYLYTKKSTDVINAQSKEDVVAAFIRNRASEYCLMTSYDSQFNFNQHKYLVARYEDIFLSHQDLNLIRIQIKAIFDTAIDEVELVIDVGRLQSFPDCLKVNNICWDTDANILGRFPGTITRISIIGDGLTTVGQRFLFGCTSLSTLTIPNSVISIKNSFLFGCTSLSTLTIPNSVISI